MQSKKSSIIEIILNTASGFIISLSVTFVIMPYIKMGMISELNCTLIFTVVSLLRSYIWRRVFNRYAKKAARV